MKKEFAVQLVENSVSSIFSKEDVIKLINSIEEGSGRKITTNDIERAIDKVINWVDNNERDLLDLDSAELELDYNKQISVEFDERSLYSEIESAIDDAFETDDEAVLSEALDVLEHLSQR